MRSFRNDLGKREQLIVNYTLLNLKDESLILLRDSIVNEINTIEFSNKTHLGVLVEMQVVKNFEFFSKLLKQVLELNTGDELVTEVLQLIVNGFDDWSEPVISVVTRLVTKSITFKKSTRIFKREIQKQLSLEYLFEPDLYKIFDGFIKYRFPKTILDLTEDQLLLRTDSMKYIGTKILVDNPKLSNQSYYSLLESLFNRIMILGSDLEIKYKTQKNNSNNTNISRFMDNSEFIRDSVDLENSQDLVFSISPRISPKRMLNSLDQLLTMKRIPTTISMDQLAVFQEPRFEIDIHELSVDDALHLLSNIVRHSPKQTEKIYVIHGYRSGIELQKSLTIENFKLEKIRSIYSSMNPGISVIELKVEESQQKRNKFKESPEDENGLINRLVDSLSPNGILLYVLPSIELSSEIDRIGRENLINQNIVRAVVDLPNNISKVVNSPISLLIISKKGKNTHFLNLRESNIDSKLTDLFIKSIFDTDSHEENIFAKLLLDWSSDWRKKYTSNWGHSEKWTIGLLPSFKDNIKYEEFNEFSKFVTTLSLEAVKYQGNQLSAEKLFYKKLAFIKDSIELNSILDHKQDRSPIFRGINVKNDENHNLKGLQEIVLYYLRLEDIDNFSINYANKVLTNVPLEKYNRFFLEEGDLLITARSSQIKTAVVNKIGDRLVVPSENLYVIRADKSKVNPYFLKAYFDSELGKNQINSYRMTRFTNLSVLSVGDLRKFSIPNVSLQEQDKVAETFLDRQKRVINAKSSLSSAEKNYYSAFDKVFSTYGNTKL